MSRLTPLRIASIGLMIATAVVGCYPEFTFGDDGEGGQGGQGTSVATVTATTNTSTSVATTSISSSAISSSMMSSSSTGPPPPQVGCGPVSNQMLTQCEPNDECCFHKTTVSLDACSNNGCGTDYISFSCDGPDDCTPGQVCCAVFDEDFFGPFFTGPIGCATQCPSPSIVMCETSADCPSGTCQQIFSLSGYATEYLGCE